MMVRPKLCYSIETAITFFEYGAVDTTHSYYKRIGE